MNLLGKVFIVLIFVMSIVFMAFAVAVFQTHKSWKNVVENENATPTNPLGLKFQLANAEAEKAKVETEREGLQRQLDELRDRKDQAIAKLEHYSQTLKEERDELAAKNTEIEQQRTQLANQLQISLAQLKNAEAEREALRQEIVKVQDTRDSHYKEMVRLTDELNQARNDYKLAKAANAKLLEQVSKMSLVLQEKFPNWQTIADGQDPPLVFGLVTENKNNEYVATTLGSDDGIRSGNQLEIYRGDKYIGRVNIIKTDPDRSVAEVMREYLKAPIQEGDRVRTKFEN